MKLKSVSTVAMILISVITVAMTLKILITVAMILISVIRVAMILKSVIIVAVIFFKLKIRLQNLFGKTPRSRLKAFPICKIFFLNNFRNCCRIIYQSLFVDEHKEKEIFLN